MAPNEVRYRLLTLDLDVKTLIQTIQSQVSNQHSGISSLSTKAQLRSQHKSMKPAKFWESRCRLLEMNREHLIKPTATMGPERNGLCGGCLRSLREWGLRYRGTA